MIERFEGDAGKFLRIEVLRSQKIVQGDAVIATKLSELVTLRELNCDDVLIVEGERDNDMYFLLSGQVSIRVKGREVANREANDHIGEMALIHPAAKRSASVVAVNDETVVARISEPTFSALANDHPRLWRLIAVELCERLRQRNKLVRNVNQHPVLFVGSSGESLPIAREVQDGLKHDKIAIRILGRVGRRAPLLAGCVRRPIPGEL